MDVLGAPVADGTNELHLLLPPAGPAAEPAPVAGAPGSTRHPAGGAVLPDGGVASAHLSHPATIATGADVAGAGTGGATVRA